MEFVADISAFDGTYFFVMMCLVGAAFLLGWALRGE